MEHYNRFYYFYKIMTANYARLVCAKNGVKAEPCEWPEGPCLVLANHTNVNDHFYVLKAIDYQHVFYVAYDLMMRNPFLRVLLELFVNPIVHRKGLSGVVTIKEMMKRLKGGYNVLLFPEGNRNFDGRTGEILPTVGKVAKVCGANLILVRVEGGYFATPRWSLTARRGKIKLTSKVIPASTLAMMETEEINHLVMEELTVDAYEIQEREMTPYRGRRLGEGMEAALYRCPECGHFGKLESAKDRLFCRCGFSAKYDIYGYLNRKDGSKQTVSELIDAQKEWLSEVVKGAEEESEHPLFQDDLILNTYDHKNRRKRIGLIHLEVYEKRIRYSIGASTKDGLSVQRGEILPERIKGLAISNRNVLTVFLHDKEQGFELLGEKRFNALKYRDLYEIWGMCE